MRRETGDGGPPPENLECDSPLPERPPPVSLPGKRRRNPASHLPMDLEVFTATTQGENARFGGMDR